jgi:two-component system phosphate regulon sensor histidine kinase PhoR
MSIFWRMSYIVILTGIFVLCMFVAANYQMLNASLYLMAYVLLVFLLFFGFFVGQSVSRPLRKIVKTANDVASGNLKSQADIKTHDEFGQLASALNSIAAELQKVHQEKEEVRQSAGQKVNFLVKPVYQTIDALEEKVAHRTMAMHRANQLSEKLQIDLVFKEAELLDLKEKLEKSKRRKSKSMLS